MDCTLAQRDFSKINFEVHAQLGIDNNPLAVFACKHCALEWIKQHSFRRGKLLSVGTEIKKEWLDFLQEQMVEAMVHQGS